MIGHFYCELCKTTKAYTTDFPRGERCSTRASNVVRAKS